MPTPAAPLSTVSTDSAKRSARTGIQGGISAVLLVQGWNLFAPNPLTAEQSAWLIAAGSAVPALVAFLMNMLEDAGMPALFKGTPPPTDDTTQRMLADLAEEFAALREAVEQQGRARRIEPVDPPFLIPGEVPSRG